MSTSDYFVIMAIDLSYQSEFKDSTTIVMTFLYYITDLSGSVIDTYIQSVENHDIHLQTDRYN